MLLPHNHKEEAMDSAGEHAVNRNDAYTTTTRPASETPAALLAELRVCVAALNDEQIRNLYAILVYLGLMTRSDE
jgi:hypothetical protein